MKLKLYYRKYAKHMIKLKKKVTYQFEALVMTFSENVSMVTILKAGNYTLLSNYELIHNKNRQDTVNRCPISQIYIIHM